MSKRIISEKTQKNLETLKEAGILESFYLAGGTGLALQLEHRVSFDLDFFNKDNFNSSNLQEKIKDLGGFSVEKREKNTLAGVFNGTNVSFLSYDYPLLKNLKEIKGIKIASIEDIACMKLSAVSSRGTKKDFIDLFFICKEEISLKNLLSKFEEKYREVDYNISHILKSLTYFKEAENDPMPEMIKDISWEKVKDFFRNEVKNINF